MDECVAVEVDEEMAVPVCVGWVVGVKNLVTNLRFDGIGHDSELLGVEEILVVVGRAVVYVIFSRYFPSRIDF